MNPAATRQFDAKSDASRFLSERFRLALDWTQLAAEPELIDRFEVEESVPPGPLSAPALSKAFRYVIRDDDLKLLDAVFAGLQASASGGFLVAAGVSEPARLAALFAIVAALVKLGREVLTKGASLAPRELAVLVILRQDGPLPFDKLLRLLKKSDKKWTEPSLRQMLDRLQKLPCRDGTTIQVVAWTDDEWRTAGI